MVVPGVIVRGLVLAVCVSGPAVGAQDPAPPVVDARAGFCVGVDGSHAADFRTTVTFFRGDETLGKVSGVVMGPVSVPVTPGEVTVLVDGTVMATFTVTSGTTAYGTSGRGCPATLPP
jgi:hypothetical protein